MQNSQITIGLAIILGTVTVENAGAADICQAVLNAPLDVYNGTVSSSIKSAILDKFCSIHWSSVSELRKRAESIDTGGSVMNVFSGFLKTAKSSEESSVRQAFDSVCNDYNSSYSNQMFSSENRQSSDEIVRAWRDCAKRQIGLFSAVRSIEDSRDFKIDVSYRTVESNPTHFILQSPSDMAGFRCTFNGKETKNLDITAEGAAGDFVIDCQKTTANSAVVALNTSKGTIGPFDLTSDLLGQAYLRLDALGREITQLQQNSFVESNKVEAIQGGRFKIIAGTKVTISGGGGQRTEGSVTCVDGDLRGIAINAWGETYGPTPPARQYIVAADGHPDANDPSLIHARVLANSDPSYGSVQFYALCAFKQ
ncbi:hypothetical protein GOA99_18635 [Sinorhizobium meliloti]|nr:hypothetical protein [Sinorhizobium meliloti]